MWKAGVGPRGKVICCAERRKAEEGQEEERDRVVSDSRFGERRFGCISVCGKAEGRCALEVKERTRRVMKKMASRT